MNDTHEIQYFKCDQQDSLSFIWSAANDYKPHWENTIYFYAALPHWAECKGISMCVFMRVLTC